MRYIKEANLPKAPVKVVIVDGRISEEAEKSLLDMNIRVIKTIKYQGLYEAISCHPDIMLHHLGGDRMVYAPGTSAQLLEELHNLGFKLIEGGTPLTGTYPGDISYNVAVVGNFAFHNTKYTDNVLKSELYKRDIELVHVNQGYTKCSVSVVDDSSIITSDVGICKAAEKKGLDVLLIEPDQNIELYGLDYGFIGGSSGLIDKDKWALSGNFEKLKSADLIYDFLKSKSIKIISLTHNNVVDIGSILPVLTE